MVPLAFSILILFALTTLVRARVSLLSDGPSRFLDTYTLRPHDSHVGQG